MCKPGYARCPSGATTGSCLSMSTTSNCNQCTNACKAPYSKCDKEMGCVGTFKLPATLQLCKGAVGAQTCAAPLFGVGYASIETVAKTVPLRTSSGELRQMGMLAIVASMGTKIKSVEGMDVVTGAPVQVDSTEPRVEVIQHPTKGWTVLYIFQFSFSHVPKIRLYVTVEQPNGKELRLKSEDMTNNVPPGNENAISYGSRMCLY